MHLLFNKTCRKINKIIFQQSDDAIEICLQDNTNSINNDIEDINEGTIRVILSIITSPFKLTNSKCIRKSDAR